MKNQLFLFCSLFVFALSGCSKKTEIDPTPSSSTSTKEARLSGFTWTQSTPSGGWLSSSFLDQNTGYISGLGGAMIKTTTGGSVWTSVTGLPAVDLYACYFSTASDGFVAGNYNTAAGTYTAYKTTNGGTTWTLLSLPVLPANTSFRSIYFYDASIGFIGGGNGVILKTTDGGTTWALSNTGVGGTQYALYSFVFFNATEGLASGSHGRMYKTINGGASWTPSVQHDAVANLSCIAKSTSDSVFVTTSIGGNSIGAKTTYLASADKGAHWSKGIIPGPYQALQSIKIFNLSNVYMVGGSVANNTGVIFSNINYAGWTQEIIPASGRLCTAAAIEFSPGNGVLFAAGLNNSVLKGQ